MEIEQVSLADLEAMAAPYNPRRISSADLERLSKSLTTFGVVEPVVVNRTTGNIVGGHQRVKAAKAAGMASLPAVWVELDAIAEKQLNLALNRISGTWDDELLQALIQDLAASDADLSLTGFEDAELEKMMRVLGDGDASPDAVPDEAPERVESGSLWQLGDHRLLCGSSASAEDMARLLDGVRPEYVFTSPPYGIDLEYEEGDSLEDLETLVRDVFAVVDGVLAPKAYVTINYADVYRPGEPGFVAMTPLYVRSLPKAWNLRGNRVWVKPFGRLALSYGTGTTMNLREWEYVRTWRNFEGKEELRQHGTTLRGVWKTFGDDCIAGEGWEDLDETTDKATHPAAFPVVLPTVGLRAYSDMGAAVLEPFCGSGTTVIACERADRRCFAMELDPKYCDIVLERWQQFAGREAVRLDA